MKRPLAPVDLVPVLARCAELVRRGRRISLQMRSHRVYAPYGRGSREFAQA